MGPTAVELVAGVIDQIEQADPRRGRPGPVAALMVRGQNRSLAATGKGEFGRVLPTWHLSADQNLSWAEQIQWLEPTEARF